MVPLTERLAAVQERIERAGRPASEVRVVAVTKGFGPEAATAAVAAGLTAVGENYAQELVAKAPVVPGAVWHFLGPVQRNKVKALAPHVAVWQGIDREAAGQELVRQEASPHVLVQVNLAGDPARPGVSWDDAPALVERLRELGLDVEGLMGVASRDGARAEFRRLATLARELELRELSMGMSGDLEVAVEEGATVVRVGTALFGARPGTTSMRR